MNTTHSSITAIPSISTSNPFNCRIGLSKNSLDRAVNRTSKHYRSYHSILNSLHWLKIPQSIHFKHLPLTHNTLQNSQPKLSSRTLHYPANPQLPDIPNHHPE